MRAWSRVYRTELQWSLARTRPKIGRRFDTVLCIENWSSRVPLKATCSTQLAEDPDGPVPLLSDFGRNRYRCRHRVLPRLSQISGDRASPLRSPLSKSDPASIDPSHHLEVTSGPSPTSICPISYRQDPSASFQA